MEGVVELDIQGSLNKVIISKVGEIFELNLEKMHIMLFDQQSKETNKDGSWESLGDKVVHNQETENMLKVMDKSLMDLDQFQLNHAKDLDPLGMA